MGLRDCGLTSFYCCEDAGGWEMKATSVLRA